MTISTKSLAAEYRRVFSSPPKPPSKKRKKAKKNSELAQLKSIALTPTHPHTVDAVDRLRGEMSPQQLARFLAK